MDMSKLAITIGNISFSGEGDSTWLSDQLDKILDQAEQLTKLAPPKEASAANQNQHKAADFSKASDIANKTLATFLKEKSATVKQVEKFLATAIWLEAKGKNRISTADVSGALKASNQSKINNPADCLNQNVAKGYCEKEGKEFFVTQEGKEALGM